MKYLQALCPIVAKEEIAKGIFDVSVFSKEMAELAKPGQFVHILCEGHTLRRPISICEIDKEKGLLRLVYEVRGEGTKKLSRLFVTDKMDIIGPLGHGFKIDDTSKKVAIVGGGIGVPPLLELASKYKEKATVILGFRTASAAILAGDFVKKGCSVRLATEDGSLGYKGFVTGPLNDLLSREKVDIIFACGPTPMLKAVAEIAQRENIDCQVSLEQRMACGIGACLTCACSVKGKNKEDRFAHVCKEGPVFDAKEVNFHD